MTGFNSKRDAAADKDALFEKFEVAQPAQEPSTIIFSANDDWVIRITADRRIEVNERVEVTEAAKKVLEAMQWMLKPAQEPIAWMYQCIADNSGSVLLQHRTNWAESGSGLWIETPLYTTPPQREWVGLNEKERNDIEDDFYANISIHVFDAIEAKLKEKNT